jgi:hypothetical protein
VAAASSPERVLHSSDAFTLPSHEVKFVQGERLSRPLCSVGAATIFGMFDVSRLVRSPDLAGVSEYAYAAVVSRGDRKVGNRFYVALVVTAC